MAKKAAPEQNKASGYRISNSRIVYIGIAVILLLSGLQFFLILTLGDDSLKPLARDRVHQVVVNRVIDMRFPSFREPVFRRFLARLSNRIVRRTGFRVSFLVKKTVLAENYISQEDTIFTTSAARDWFRKRGVEFPCRQGKNFDWLNAILGDPVKRKVLAVRYGRGATAALKKRVAEDFTRRFKKLRGMRDRYGKRYFDEGGCFRAAAVCWAYLLSGQVNSDFIVSNAPVFYPSSVTPADAVTRGGLVYSLIANSRRSLQGVLLLSLYPVHRLPAAKRAGVSVRLALQGFARLLLRRPFEVRNKKSLLYPVFGNGLQKWAEVDRTIVFENAPVLERF